MNRLFKEQLLVNTRFGLFGWLIGLLLLSCSVSAQQTVTFVPVFQGSPLQLDSHYVLDTGDTLHIQRFKFYVANIQLLHHSSKVNECSKKHCLIDLEDSQSQSIVFDQKKQQPFNSIQFQLGVDSATNYKGAMGEDLDPSKGMYWTWNSGYINFKLEGKSSNCPARHHQFMFHIGGFQHPNNACQTVILPLQPQQDIVVEVAIDAFLAPIDLSKDFRVMSPNKTSVALSQRLASSFRISK